MKTRREFNERPLLRTPSRFFEDLERAGYEFDSSPWTTRFIRRKPTLPLRVLELKKAQ